eukprot:CAMPEP_0198146486 /NCGR_PEP_ID=MMETSP1443-20131203/29609_1 /TAXON_ID=186043 /ORGANISM="Entomoneis sp., Strain CCMP2396" /LENGTH=201 /DNA_ID=CAMNT_0043810471 /DNA_START=214 /DNA_END=819 /DNA_ORIENTATION=-
MNAMTNSQQQSQSSGGGALESVLIRFKELGINFLAIDFDMTMIDVHTGGRWMGTAQELETHVRPEFVELIQTCLLNDIQVAICTFSPQVPLIQHVLEQLIIQALPTPNNEQQTYSIPIRGGDRSWTYQGNGSRHGKQGHIASAVEEMLSTAPPDLEITKQTTVLIDDDRRNIRHALQDGTRAVWFNPDKPHHLLRELKRLV